MSALEVNVARMWPFGKSCRLPRRVTEGCPGAQAEPPGVPSVKFDGSRRARNVSLGRVVVRSLICCTHRATLISVFIGVALCQSIDGPLTAASESSAPNIERGGSASGNAVLGPLDQLTIWALGVSEIPDKPLQIADDGLIDVPMLGRVRAAGLTVSQFKEELIARLQKYIQTPQVSVSVTEFHSRPISVVGAVNHPGVYQLQGQNSVLEVISVAGGFGLEAGQVVKVTRRADSFCEPLAERIEGPNGSYTTATLNLRELIDAKSPGRNLTVCPHDIVTVPRADMVYVVGEVQKPGAFPVNERASYTVLQALTMAGGLTPNARPNETKLLRSAQTATREEIPVDLKRLLSSKAKDMELKPGDILFVPNSIAKSAGRKAVETAIQLAVGVTVFRR